VCDGVDGNVQQRGRAGSSCNGEQRADREPNLQGAKRLLNRQQQGTRDNVVVDRGRHKAQTRLYRSMSGWELGERKANGRDAADAQRMINTQHPAVHWLGPPLSPPFTKSSCFFTPNQSSVWLMSYSLFITVRPPHLQRTLAPLLP
jgi:hypothetical protein